ncbi:MAG: type IV pilus modification protein PilV [Burkholderiales bacterium]|nr:type IV pilus modification protein PilV [Burkholderiales bacterium]
MQRINRPHPTTAHRRQRGITLIESLVALVISVLGIIGILGMQMRTLVDSQTATRRAQAVRLIEDLSERMRVHPNALINIKSYKSDFDDLPSANGCTDTACTPAALITRDLGSWKQSVRTNLPLGQASIFVAPWDAKNSTASQIGIMVSWRANESADMTKDDLNNLDTTKVREGDKWISATGKDGVECPDGRICHLQYISVAARCGFDSKKNKAYCPGRQ